VSDPKTASELSERPTEQTRERGGDGPSAPKLGRFQTPLTHRLGERLIRLTAVTAIAAVALIFLFVAREALPLLWEAESLEELGGWEGLFLPQQWRGYAEPTFVWQPVGHPGKFSIVPLFVGTLKVTVLTMLISVPLGVGSAIFVSQYASRRVREVVKPAVEMLAGVPSVVVGFFALVMLASLVQDATGLLYRLNGLVAALGLSVAVVPVVFTISEDALATVPRSLVEASVALGARKHQTTTRVVLPAALPGISAAIVLGFGRAIGETMIVLMASGNAAVMELFDPTTSVRTVTATIAAELGEVGRGDPHWRILFLLGALLFAVTFLLNWVGQRIVKRLEARLKASA